MQHEPICDRTIMSNNRKWTEIAEYIALIASTGGAVVAVLLEQVAYVAAPVSLALLLNLVNRQKLEQQIQRGNATEITQLYQQLSGDFEALRASVLAAAAESNGEVRQALVSLDEALAELSEEVANTDTNLQNRLSVLETMDVNSLQSDLAQLRNQSAYVLETLANVLQRLDTLSPNDKLDALERQFTQQLAAIESRLAPLETLNLASIQAEISQITAHSTRVQEALATVDRQLENLSQATHSSDAIDRALNQVDEKISTLQTDIQNRLASLDLDSLQASSLQLDSIRASTGQLGEQLSGLVQSLASVTQRLETVPLPTPGISPEIFDRRIAELASAIASLQQQVNTIEQPNLMPLKEEISLVRFQTANVEAALENLTHQFSAANPPTNYKIPDEAEKWVSKIIQRVKNLQPKEQEQEFDRDEFEEDDFDADLDPPSTPVAPEFVRSPEVPSPPVPAESKIPAETSGWRCVQTLSGNSSAVTGIAIAPDSRLLVSGDYEAVKVWDLSTGELRQNLSLNATEVSVTSVALGSDGETLACAKGDIEVRNLSTGQIVRTLEVDDWTTIVAISPDGKLLASSSSDPIEQNGSIQLWDLTNGELIRTNYYVSCEISSLTFSPDGTMLALAGGNLEAAKGIVQLWNVESGKPLLTLEPAVITHAVAISPEFHLLAVGCNDNTVKLWNRATGGLVQTFSGHAGAVYAVAISPDGKLLASGSEDGAIAIWNLETGEKRQAIQDHTGGIRAIAFSPDGKTLISGAQDRLIKIWRWS